MKNTFLITTLLATTALVTSTWAECTERNNYSCGTNCTYSIYSNGDDCHLVIQGPTTTDQEGSIKKQAFRLYGKDVTSAEIIGNITSISEEAFVQTKLKSLSIPNTVTSIGQAAFYGLSNLNSVTIPSSVTSIGNSAFAETGLTTVTIPNSVTSIGDSAFYQSYSLSSVTIPDSVTSIGNYAFKDASLTSINIPESVTSIGSRAFEGTQITNLVLPDSITTIGEKAFYNARQLNSIFIGEGVTEIGANAFVEGISDARLVVFCAQTKASLCQQGIGTSQSNIQYYTKHEDGVYEMTDAQGNGKGVYYASPDKMSADTVCRTHYSNSRYLQCSFSSDDSINTCTSREQCAIDAADYKQQKAAQMAGGTLCQTTQGCLNLMDLVASSTSCKADEANSYANCSAAVKNGTITGVNLAAADPVGGGNGGSGGNGGTSEQNTPKHRIYTVQEATDRVKELGTDTVNFRIRYK